MQLEDIIKKIEADEKFKSYFGSDKPLSSGLLNDIGVLMEEGGKHLVEIRLKDKAGGDSEKISAFQKLYEYVMDIDSLNIRRCVKGYVLKKLEAIATTKIRGN